MDGNNVGSFWDVDQYRRVIKRIENGYRSCDNFLSMVQERAEIEQRYAKSIKKWNEKWSGVVEKGMEYGSSLDAWRSCIQEGTVVAQLHEECKLKIMGEHGPFYNMYKWKKEHYHKGAFGSLQEAREANDGFAAAQKEYSRLLSKTESAKKTYHAACISAHKAHLFAQDETRDESVRPEFRRKLQQRAAKLASQQEKLKQRYLKRVMKCNGSAKDHYVQDMTGELTKWQSLERVRLDTLHAQLILFVKAVDCGAKYSLEDLYRRLEETISQADSVRDVHEWDAQHGTGCPKHWPRFEEMDVNELDAAAYADVERKTSFGNALLHRRRQRSKHRRSHHNTYSSMTDIDEEDFFSSDSFDSTSTESEDVHRDNQSLTRNSAHVHHSRHQANIPETHQQSPRHEHYGHRVTNLSTNYGGQLDSQSQSLSHRTRPTNHLRHQHERTSRHDADLQTERSDHRKLGERHRHSHYIPSNTAKQHQRVHKHNLSNQSPRPYHATQWPSNHAWHPVTYEANHHSGSTPPTRDVDVPAQIPSAQPHTSIVGNHPHSEQHLTPSSSNQRTVGTPIQSYHQVNVPKYAGQALTTYGTPYNVQTTQEKVPASTTTNYQETYQGTPNTGHLTTNTSTNYQGNYYQGATTTASTPANYQGETATAITPTSYQRTYQGETATASTPTNYQGTYQRETATGHATTNIPTNYHGTPDTGHATVNTPTNYQGDYQRTPTSEYATTNTPTNYGTPSTGPSNTQQTATATPTNYQGATTGHSTSGTQQTTNNSPSSTLSWWHLHNQQQATPHGSEIRSDGQTTSARHERHTTVDRAKQLLHLEDNEFMVRALYDFKAGTRDEIPLKKGEVLVQTGKHLENGWASGRNLEKAGIFPASYVQVVR